MERRGATLIESRVWEDKMKKEIKEILWIRKLSCGHERPTNISFINGIYVKPQINEDCYCRECCEDVKIIGVKKYSQMEVKDENKTRNN